MPSATKAAKKQLTSRLLPIFVGYRHLHAHYKKIAEIKKPVSGYPRWDRVCGSPTTAGKKEGENHYDDEDARSLV